MSKHYLQQNQNRNRSNSQHTILISDLVKVREDRDQRVHEILAPAGDPQQRFELRGRDVDRRGCGEARDYRQRNEIQQEAWNPCRGFRLALKGKARMVELASKRPVALTQMKQSEYRDDTTLQKGDQDRYVRSVRLHQGLYHRRHDGGRPDGDAVAGAEDNVDKRGHEGRVQAILTKKIEISE